MTDKVKLGVWDEFTGGYIPVDVERLLKGLGNMKYLRVDNNRKAGSKLKPLDDPFREKVQQVLYPLEDLLVAKNEAYGNSALDPVNIFSKSTAVEQIKVRIDDKLSRLYHGKEYGDEDTVTDLMGYLTILKIAQKEQADAGDMD